MRETAELIQRLLDRSPSVREESARRLGFASDPTAVLPLVDLLRDPIDRVQVAAATALGRLHDARAVRPLLHSFLGQTYALTRGDGSPGQYFMIVESAARALAAIGTTEAVEALLSSLAQKAAKTEDQTAAAAAALATTRDSRVLSALLSTLDSSSHFVRYYAVRALGLRGETSAVPSLIGALRDSTWTVQVVAAEALGTIRDARALPELQLVFERLNDFMLATSVDHSRGFSERFHFRAKAARGLGLIGEPPGISALANAQQSIDRELRLAATVGLAYSRSPSAYALPIEALAERESAVRIETIEALEFLADSRAVPALEALWRSPNATRGVVETAKQAIDSLQRGELKSHLS